LVHYLCTREGLDKINLICPGSAGRNRVLALKRLPEITVPLPSLDEQHRIVARVEALAAGLAEAEALRKQQQSEAKQLLVSMFHRIADKADRAPMKVVAPLVRRPVTPSFDVTYPELGVRSFFKGTFHKPPLTALELGSKRVFSIEPGDLIFSNVFAWEGAIAIASKTDANRVGSHRFITCVPAPNVAEARFLLQYFQTEEGFSRIQEASPGGALRNRTLGLKALENIDVPVPPIKSQQWFAQLHSKVENLFSAQQSVAPLYDAMVPAVLERAFSA
jgi:type I restriction enzyme, S subunit